MKKTYSTPVMDIKKFDVIDVITVSGTDPVVKTENAASATNGEYDAAVGIEW
jgi:hypothetical protein